MTPRKCLTLAIAALAVAVTAALAVADLAASMPQRQPRAERPSVWDGVYTDEQAARGQMQYAYSCGRCHLEELQGDASRDVPPLNDERFLKYWSGRSLKELFDLTSKTMPADSPASLRARSYLEILAYVLQMNRFPAGSHELDPERLDQILFDKAPSAPDK